MISRTLGDCVYGAPIDVEVGSLDHPTLLSAEQQKFTYVRYNAAMDTTEVGVPLTNRDLRLDNLKIIDRLREMGRTYADSHVRPEHLWPRGQRPRQ